MREWHFLSFYTYGRLGHVLSPVVISHPTKYMEPPFAVWALSCMRSYQSDNLHLIANNSDNKVLALKSSTIHL